MADEQNKTPATDDQSDVSKSQAAQQPTGQQGQQPEFGQDQAAGQPDDGFQSDTATRQDTEGASQSKEKGESESGFVGSQSDSDTSSELVEDEDFAKDGQGAPDAK